MFNKQKKRNIFFHIVFIYLYMYNYLPIPFYFHIYEFGIHVTNDGDRIVFCF